jgi:hypothetical protein
VTDKPAAAKPARAKSEGLSSMVVPMLRLAAATAAGRAIKTAAVDATTKALLTLGAALAGAVGIFCFSAAALTVMERYIDPAEAWTAMGCLYGLVGAGLYLAATRRR